MDAGDEAAAVEIVYRRTSLAAREASAPATGRGPIWENGVPICRECGEEIPAERLAAIPGCELCVDCAD